MVTFHLFPHLRKIFIILLALAFFCSCKTLKKGKEEAPVLTLEYDEIEVSALPPPYKGSDPVIFRLLHTKLDLWPNIPMKQMKGVAVLDLTPHAYPQDTVVLDARNFQFTEIYDAKDPKKRGLQFRYHNNKIYIGLRKTAKPGDTIRIAIDYVALPELPSKPGTQEKKDQKGLYFINPEGKDSLMPIQFWTQGETHHNSAWMPTIESPNQKTTQEISITIDSQYVTLSNGALVSSKKNNNGTRTDIWKLARPHAPYLAMIAAGKWKIVKDKWRDSIPVNYYIEPAYAPYAKLIFGNTPEMMTYFSGLLKYDYPWPKLSQVVVREFVSGAMENTSAVVHFDLLQHDARSHLDETYEDVIAHELFHHWFGDLVTCESWSQLAMNEAFATMSEYLWKEYKYGRQEEALKRQEDMDAYLREATYNKEPVINHYYRDPEALFDRHRYEKGGLILHMLRAYLGDKVFFKALNQYLKEREYKTTEVHRLRMAFEEACGEDLNWFFDQWFFSAGHPELVIKQHFNAEKKKLYLFTEQKQEGEEIPVFRLPVDVDIYINRNKERKRVWLENKLDTFTFDVAENPLLVNFDAGKNLLCQKREYKPHEQWIYQFQRAPLYLDKIEALEAIASVAAQIQKDTLNTIIKTALSDSFWNIRKAGLELFFKNRELMALNNFSFKIRELALNDNKSAVRKTAIAILHRTEGEGARDIYKKALEDSSYQVVVGALEAYFRTAGPEDSTEIMKIAAEFENYSNPEVLYSVAGIYAKSGKINKLPFFHKVINLLGSHYSSTILSMYKDLLLQSNMATLKAELPFIFRLDKRMHSNWSRFAYKIFLNDLRHELKRGKLIKQKNIEEKQLEEIISQLEQKANTIEISGGY